jgi:protein-S-isoprenylcysteine O-methyltransferase Ste14
MEGAKPHQHGRALERFYSSRLFIVGGQPLVRSDPYRFTRHPAYAGYLLIVLGLAHRIRIEDKLPAEHFGARFKNYVRKTKRLISKVW